MAALAEALSALDRAAKVGAIHPNAAARRKSRLTRKVNAALGGEHVQTGGRVVKTTGKAAAAKAAKARIAAGKAGKAKGAQTAAGKARAALSKTARAEAAAAKAAAAAERRRRGRRRPRRPADQGDAAAKAKTTPTKAAAPRRPPPQDRQDGRRRPRAKATAQGRAQGQEGRDQGVGLAARTARRRPGLRRGVSIPAPRRGSGERRSGRAPTSGSAGRGFGRKTPYSAAPPSPPTT